MTLTSQAVTGHAKGPRIALIHALAHSMSPVVSVFCRDWPEAKLTHLLDDSLSQDLADSPCGLDATMTQRFLTLGDYVLGTGADALLFTCSAFGPCIEAVASRHADRPVLKPNEAMVADAVAWHARHQQPVGLVASFGPTLQSMPAEFPPGFPLRTALAEGAMAALNAGDVSGHDERVVKAASALKAQGCGLIALAQFSLARAAAAVTASTGLVALDTPSSAVRALRERLGPPGLSER